MYTVPNNNLNISLGTETVTAGENATAFVWILNTCIWLRNQTYTVASAPTVIGLVFYEEIHMLFRNNIRILNTVMH